MESTYGWDGSFDALQAETQLSYLVNGNGILIKLHCSSEVFEGDLAAALGILRDARDQLALQLVGVGGVAAVRFEASVMALAALADGG